MSAFARKAVACLTAGSLALSSLPPARADGGAPSVTPAQALAKMREWGVYTDDKDVMKTYLGDDKKLTAIGQVIYESLSVRYNPSDAATALKPTFDNLRQKGPYDPTSGRNATRVMNAVSTELGRINGMVDGSMEGLFRRGALTQAALTGAAVVDPPNPATMTPIRTAYGVDLYDDKGLAYRLNSQNATIYNRDLQKNQRAMNKHPVPQVAFVPETGRYNKEVFEYSYWSLKNQLDGQAEGLRRDRMIALAELLGKAGQYRSDMWFMDKTLEPDLIAEAKGKTYSHNGKTYSVYDIVEARLAQREVYLTKAQAGVDRYKADMDTLIASLKNNPVIGDSAVKTLALDEQSTRLSLSKGALEAQMFFVKNQQEHLDAASPDSKQVMDAVDDSDLPPELKAKFKQRAVAMVARLEKLRQTLESTRRLLDATDYASSLDAANAILTASQTELSDISTDYSIYVEVPSVAALAKQQTDMSALNVVGKGMRKVYGMFDNGYRDDMEVIGKNRQDYEDIVRLFANGDDRGARARVIGMNKDAADKSFETSLFGDQSVNITDNLRVAASLKANRDRIVSVFEKNKWLDTAASVVNWAIAIGLGGGIARRFLSGLSYAIQPLTGLEAAEGASWAARAATWTLRRSAILVSESAQHTAARLETLETATSRAATARIENGALRYLAESGVRSLNVAARQVTFTAMSGVISGGFTLGSHLWSQAHLEVGGHQVLQAGHSMFSDDFDGAKEAFWAGAKGGIWWANESWHPALNYVGLPSTAFRGTRLAGAMDVLGARGVVDSAWSGMKGIASWIRPTARALAGGAEAAADKGLIDRLAEKGLVGKTVAFPLSMADNVAKYALVSSGASWVAREVAYVTPSSVPLLGRVTWGSEDDIERRIKGANNAGQTLMAAPVWLALPTFSAHVALDAQSYMGAQEGMKQYDALGLTHKYANAETGRELPFLETPKTPISQRIFDFHFFRDPPAEKWVVTEQVKRSGYQKEMLRSVGGEKAKPVDVDPFAFYGATKLEDGQRFIQLKANDEVRLVAHQDFTEALIADPARARAILDAPLYSEYRSPDGRTIRVTPEVRKDVAVALFSSEIQIGKAMPKELRGRVGEILKPYLEANQVTREPASQLVDVLGKLSPSKEFDSVLDGIRRATSDWKDKSATGGATYMDFVGELRAQAARLKSEGKISELQAQVLGKLYDYVSSINDRFNSFNKVDTAYTMANESLQALITELGKRPAPASVLRSWSAKLDQWRKGRRPDDLVFGPKDGPKGGPYGDLISEMRGELQQASGLTSGDRQTLSKAIDELEANPWTLHNAQGRAIPGWRPEQFEALMGTLTYFVGKHPEGSVRIFQMLKTGGGKTMLAFEGLLPLIEADAAKQGKQVVFLTVQSNLEAQARMDFIAFKKIGSKLTFDTYEGFKTKIAEGKTKGKNALRDYWILGDEMDGAALQPALTIGQVSGRVSREAPVYRRVEALDEGLGNRVDSAQSARGIRAQSEVRRADFVLSGLDTPNADAIKAELDRLDAATGRLGEASGPLDRWATETEVRESSARLQKLLEAAGGGDAIASAQQALGRLKDILDKPATDRRTHGDVIDALVDGFKREGNLLELTGSEAGLARVAEDASAASAKLAGRLDSLAQQLEAAEGSKAPGAGERARALREEIALTEREKEMADLFVAQDSGQRLSSLQDRIAAARAEPGAASPEKLAGWTQEAADLQASLPRGSRETAQARAETLARVYSIGQDVAVLDDAIAKAKSEGRPTQDLETQRAALESDHATVSAEARRLKDELSAGSARGDLGGMLRSVEALKGDASASGERADVLDEALAEVRNRLDASADQIMSVVREGAPGWEDAALRLLERRRALVKSFAADENPLYSVFKQMHNDMQGYAMNEGLRSKDAVDNKLAQEKFARFVDGESSLSFLPKLPKLLWEVFRGQEVDIPLDHVGLTRLRAAQMLKALFADPTLPAHQADGLFWNLVTSVLWPKGLRGRGSWVRTELKRQLDGFFEDPAGIRLDNRTGRINVVHNGQWFEAMDNETRRFWEILYGTDLTLPYTHQSISTIKDVTTDKDANFISFSGTAGDKLREHFRKNDITIAMENAGSKAPDYVSLDLTSRPAQSIDRIGQALADANSSRGEVVVPELRDAPVAVRAAVVDRAGGALPEPVTLDLAQFADPASAGDRAWLASHGSRQGDKVVLKDLRGAPPAVREAALDAMGGSAVLRLADFADPKLAQAGAWLKELRSLTGDADGVILRVKKDAIPPEAKPALDAYLSDPKLKGKDEVVVRISDVQGKTDAQTAAARRWLRDLRSNQKDTSLVVLSVSDTRVLKTVRQYLMRVKGIKADEIAMVFSDTEYLRNNVPEAEVAKQMNLGALQTGRARVLILDTRVGGRGLDLNFKGEGKDDPTSFRGYTDFQMLIVDPHKMSQVHLLQAEGRIDVGRVQPNAARSFGLVMDVNSVADYGIFRKMIDSDPFFAARRADPEFRDFMKARGASTVDWRLLDDYIRQRAADGSEEGLQLAEQYQDAVKRALETQQSQVEEGQLRSSSVLNDGRASSNGVFPGVEGLR